MTWWWPWRARSKLTEQAREDELERRRQEAAQAVASAEQALQEVQQQWPEVLQRAEVARRTREEDHLADLVRRNLRGRHA